MYELLVNDKYNLKHIRKLSISFKDQIFNEEIDDEEIGKQLLYIEKIQNDLIDTINSLKNIETLLIADVSFEHIGRLNFGFIKDLTMAFQDFDDDPTEYLHECLSKPNSIQNIKFHLIGFEFNDFIFISDYNIEILNNCFGYKNKLQTIVFRGIAAIPKPYKPDELLKDLDPEGFLEDFLTATRIYRIIDDVTFTEIECPIGKLSVISDVYYCGFCVNCAQQQYDSFKIC